MLPVLTRIARFGVREDLDAEVVKRIRLINTMVLVCVPMAFITTGYLLGSVGLSLVSGILLLIVWMAILLPPILHLMGRYQAARIGICTLSLTSVVTLTYLLGTSSHIHFFLITGAVLPYVYFLRSERTLRFLFFILSALLFIYLDLYLAPEFSTIEQPTEALPYIRTINHVMLFVLLFALIYFFQHETEVQLDQNERQAQLLENRNVLLEEKNRELEHFAYIASHDLNEPLRTVDGFVGIIREEYHDPKDETIGQYFDFIGKGLQRMRSMIDYLLTYSRLGSQSDFQSIDPAELLRDVQSDLHQRIADRGVQFDIGPLEPIRALPVLRQVFFNLITNAIKFQPSDATPRIEIRQETAGDFWRFCVADNGIGIPPEKQQEVFQMFRKLHRTADYDGQGIGLAFSKRIVEVHGGRMWVESEPGAGSRFWFTVRRIG